MDLFYQKQVFISCCPFSQIYLLQCYLLPRFSAFTIHLCSSNLQSLSENLFCGRSFIHPNFNGHRCWYIQVNYVTCSPDLICFSEIAMTTLHHRRRPVFAKSTCSYDGRFKRQVFILSLSNYTFAT